MKLNSPLWKVNCILLILIFYLTFSNAIGKNSVITESVVKVISSSNLPNIPAKYGTGFLFYHDKAYYILTAAHVIIKQGLPYQNILVEFQGDKNKYQADLAYFYENIDVAIIN